MSNNPKKIFLLIIILFICLVIVDLPENYRVKFSLGKFSFDRIINPPRIDVTIFGIRVAKSIKTHLGLDLAGGTQLTLEADMSKIKSQDKLNALESARGIVERRVNFFGLSEPVIQSSFANDSYRILADLPGITNVEAAVNLIGQTAALEFREFILEKEATNEAFLIPDLVNTKSVGIFGSDLQKAELSFSSQTGEPEVAIEFTAVGSKKFAEVTSRLIGKKLAIFLDQLPLTAPVVQSAITDGKAVITGSFDRQSARTLALQLNAGALPVPIKIIQNRSIQATLGAESVARSIQAGAFGLAVVLLFMLLKYGWLGLIADLALILYGLLNLAIYRLLPVTLTLPGVAGFLLSIGMAVDSNILIFERYKEELRSGKPWRIGMELAFGKAWDSIRDANFTTLLTCMILYNPANWQFLPNSGMVRGFAITLFIGVITSLFTGIVVSRTLIRVLYKEKN